MPDSSQFDHSIQTMPPETPAQESKRAVYDACVSGAQDPPQIPHLRSDPAPSYHSLPRSLTEFRELEGREYRKARLRALWKQLPAVLDPKGTRSDALPRFVGGATLTPEGASKMREVYERELMESCGDSPGHIEWKKFKKYAEDKEAGQSSALSLSLCVAHRRINLKSRAMVYLPQRVGLGQQRPSGQRRADRGSAESGWVVLLPLFSVVSESDGSCRVTSVTFDALRLHDLLDCVSSFPLHKLPGVPRFLAVTTSTGFHKGDIPIL